METFPTPEAFPDREVLTWPAFGHAIRDLARMVAESNWSPDVTVAVARGGLVPAGALAYALDAKAIGTMNVEFYTGVGTTLDEPQVLAPALDVKELTGKRVLIVDDVADSGRTLELVLRMINERGADARTAVVYTKPRSIITPDYTWKNTDAWIMFPWSSLPPVTGVDNIDA